MYSQKFGRVQPDDVSSADSFLAEVPGVDVQRFRNALATDQMREPGLAAVRSMRTARWCWWPQMRTLR